MLLFRRSLAVAGLISPRPLDGKTLFVEELADMENQFHIFAAVEPMPGLGLYRPQPGEFRFPIAQDKRFGASQFADFANAKIQLIRDHHIASRNRY